MNFAPITYNQNIAPHFLWLWILTAIIAAATIYFAYRSDQAERRRRLAIRRADGDVKDDERQKRGLLRFAVVVGSVLTFVGFFSSALGPVAVEFHGTDAAARTTVHRLQVAAKNTYGLKLSKNDARKLLGSAIYGGKLPKTHLYGHILESTKWQPVHREPGTQGRAVGACFRAVDRAG